MLGLIHAEEENPDKKINAADEEIPPVKFEQAVDFLKSKVPMSKDEWNALEPKLRFRAFTVAKLGSAEVVDKAKQVLINALETGGNYKTTWEEIKKRVDTDSLKIKPNYWETVFRTNTQSAYIAGKLQQYDKMNVAAYQLMVIEDVRTSRICRNLLMSNGYGMIIPVDHPFWKKYGFPPYHFNCRTSLRAVLPSQIGKYGNISENPSMKSLTKFKPQEGFGGNPLDRGNWWMMTPEQIERAIKYGCLGMFNRDENLVSDFDKIWNGYTRYNGKKGGWYDLCKNPPKDWENDKFPNKPVVEFLAENGYRIKVLPLLEDVQKKYGIKWSNPDLIINGYLSDIKTVDTSILSRLKSAKEQKLRHCVLVIPDSFNEMDIQDAFSNWKHGRLSIVYIYKQTIKEIKLK
jgi:SPP1 gp7 family putative phage head morphogenesis protein